MRLWRDASRRTRPLHPLFQTRTVEGARAVCTALAARITSMSQNNHSILYVGIDIAKATFQLRLEGRTENLPNPKAGQAACARRLADAAAATPGRTLHVIL